MQAIDDGLNHFEELNILRRELEEARAELAEIRKATRKAPKKAPTAPKVGEKMTPAKAAKYRLQAMKECLCVRCFWALEPALTFQEHDRRIARTVKFNTEKSWPKCEGAK